MSSRHPCPDCGHKLLVNMKEGQALYYYCTGCGLRLNSDQFRSIRDRERLGHEGMVRVELAESVRSLSLAVARGRLVFERGGTVLPQEQCGPGPVAPARERLLPGQMNIGLVADDYFRFLSVEALGWGSRNFSIFLDARRWLNSTMRFIFAYGRR